MEETVMINGIDNRSETEKELRDKLPTELLRIIAKAKELAAKWDEVKEESAVLENDETELLHILDKAADAELKKEKGNANIADDWEEEVLVVESDLHGKDSSANVDTIDKLEKEHNEIDNMKNKNEALTETVRNLTQENAKLKENVLFLNQTYARLEKGVRNIAGGTVLESEYVQILEEENKKLLDFAMTNAKLEANTANRETLNLAKKQVETDRRFKSSVLPPVTKEPDDLKTIITKWLREEVDLCIQNKMKENKREHCHTLDLPIKFSKMTWSNVTNAIEKIIGDDDYTVTRKKDSSSDTMAVYVFTW